MASGRDLKNEMRKKLMAMNSEFADSDMLIDFVVVMLENKKAKEYVFEQLLDLTNQVQAKEITEWLFNWLSSQKSSPSSSQPPARAFQLALQQANTDSAHISSSEITVSNINTASKNDGSVRPVRPKQDLRSRLNNRGDSGDLRGLLSSRKGASVGDRHLKDEMDFDGHGSGPERTERRMDHRRSPYAPPSTARSNRQRQERSIDRTLTKCSFYPNCNREDCPFHHPSEPCPEGDRCVKGKACLYVHDAAVANPIVFPCKYAEYCTNPHCTFSHPSPAASNSLSKSVKIATVLCKYYPGCLNTQCLFLHDPTLVVVAPAHTANATDTVSTIPSTNPQQIVCRFDMNCTRFGCFYLHPSRDSSATRTATVPPISISTHKTWIAPHISERQFTAAAADETMAG